MSIDLIANFKEQGSPQVISAFKNVGSAAGEAGPERVYAKPLKGGSSTNFHSSGGGGRGGGSRPARIIFNINKRTIIDALIDDIRNDINEFQGAMK